jgi:hypothetical protein
MKFNRRQFLIFGGLALGSGFGTIACGKKGYSQIQAIAAPESNSEIHNPEIIETPRNVAPPGLYAPARGDVRIVVISDLNSAYGSTDYLPQVKRAIAFLPDWEPDLVLCGGDMVAGQKSSLSPTAIAAMWQGFDRHIAAPIRAAQLPFGFTIGNHDASGSLVDGKYLFAGDRQAVLNYWQNPAHDPLLNFIDRQYFPFYYTFQQNDIFYLTWDASTASISPEQLQWVEISLASDIAQKSKLRIVIGHLPLYPVAEGKSALAGNYLNDADSLRSLLEKYKVHTYISGHQHAYYPAYKGDLALLNTGALGDNPRPLLSGNLPPRRTLTVIDIQTNNLKTIYTTYDMDSLKVVDQNTLPSYIDAPNGRIIRRDLAH